MLFASETAGPSAWQQMVGLFVIVLAVWAIVRELEVRLILLTAALALGLLVWNPQVIVREFLVTFTNEKFIIPLCCGMGFAHVLKHTECDQHLVHLLVHPLTKARFFLVPGTVLVGFLVNMPIVSQSSTAVAIGSVIIPILRAARLSPVTIGAALLLGCSIGGELLNPGAPELITTVTQSQKAAEELNCPSQIVMVVSLTGHLANGSPVVSAALLNPDRIRAAMVVDPNQFDHERSVQRIFPLDIIGLVVVTLVFWVQSIRYERTSPESAPAADVVAPHFNVNLLKAAVPLLPIAFLYLSSYPFNWVELDHRWLGAPPTADGRPSQLFGTRLIGFAMLLGVVAAAVMTPSKVKGVVSAFFEGAGFGYAHIVSLIVVANCFGRAITELGIAELLGRSIQAWPALLIPAAGLMSLGFATLCGSGMATAQSLFGFFAKPALLLDIDPTHVGAVVSLAAAAGRTLSPVAAVTLMCARMSGAKPLELTKRLVFPILISIAILIVIAMIIAPAP